MPRVSQDYLEAQRAELLEGARRCFAEHGYEEATVVRLEEATGRSRGAIFHHFPTKLDLFLAVLERDAERVAARWETRSVAAARTNLVRSALATLVARERTAARVAPDVPDEVAARFISVVGDGLLLQQAILGAVPHAEEVIALATSALGGGFPDRSAGRAAPPPAGAGSPGGGA